MTSQWGEGAFLEGGSLGEQKGSQRGEGRSLGKVSLEEQNELFGEEKGRGFTENKKNFPRGEGHSLRSGRSFLMGRKGVP